jgi:hypothetical protein
MLGVREFQSCSGSSGESTDKESTPIKVDPQGSCHMKRILTLQTSLLTSRRSVRTAHFVLIPAAAAGVWPAKAEEIPARLEKAVTVLNKLTDSSGHVNRPGEIATADCIAVVPGFKKGAAVVGVGHGRGFTSCRQGESPVRDVFAISITTGPSTGLYTTPRVAVHFPAPPNHFSNYGG